MSSNVTNQQLKDPILLRTLLEERKRDKDFNEFIQEILLMACKLGGVTKSVELLLSYGASPDGCTAGLDEPYYLRSLNASNTPLQYCVMNDDRKSVELLLSQNADPNRRGINAPGVDGNQETPLNLPPLHLATRHGHGSMVELLLRSGCTQGSLPETGEYPIHIAAREGHAHLINLFCNLDNSWINKRSDKIIQTRGETNYLKTPLYVSAEHANLDCVLLLMDHFKADVNLKDNSHNTPLHALLSNRCDDQGQASVRYAIAVALLKANAHPNIENSEGFTPMDLAVKNNFPKIAQLLHASKGVPSSSSRKRDGIVQQNDGNTEHPGETKRLKTIDEKSNAGNDLQEQSKSIKTNPSENVDPVVDSKKHHQPNLDNEISSFSISAKEGSERMNISFDKHQNPRNISNILYDTSGKAKPTAAPTKSNAYQANIPSGVTFSDTTHLKSQTDNMQLDPSLLRKVNTSKVTTITKTTMWSSTLDDKLRQLSSTPRPERYYDENEASPVFDQGKQFSPQRRKNRSHSPLSFFSEGNRGSLNLRVVGEVPKAYNKDDKESARTKFMMHPPVTIELFNEIADHTHLSIASLPDFQTKDDYWMRSVERRMLWLDTLKKIKWNADMPMSPNSKYTSSIDPDFLSGSKVKGKLIGFFPRPYKSFGPIEIKTDALEQALDEMSDDEVGGDGRSNEDLFRSYRQQYPVRDWIKHDGQKVCPMEYGDEFPATVSPEKKPEQTKDEDGWSSDGGDRNHNRSSCCSIKMDDVMHIVQIADFEDDKVKESTKPKRDEVTSTVVASFRPEDVMIDSYHLVDVGYEDDDKARNNSTRSSKPKSNIDRTQQPHKKSSLDKKDVLSNDGKLVKMKKSQKNVVKQTDVEFGKGFEGKKDDRGSLKDAEKAKDSTIKKHDKVEDKPLKDGIFDGKKNIKSSGIYDNVTYPDEVQPSSKDKDDKKFEEKERSPIKKENLDKHVDNKQKGSESVVNPHVHNKTSISDDHKNDATNDKVISPVDNSAGKGEGNEAEDEKVKGSTADKGSHKKPRQTSMAHEAQCVRVKKKTRPRLDNVVNTSDDWSKAAIDKQAASDKWKDHISTHPDERSEEAKKIPGVIDEDNLQHGLDTDVRNKSDDVAPEKTEPIIEQPDPQHKPKVKESVRKKKASESNVPGELPVISTTHDSTEVNEQFESSLPKKKRQSSKECSEPETSVFTNDRTEVGDDETAMIEKGDAPIPEAGDVALDKRLDDEKSHDFDAQHANVKRKDSKKRKKVGKSDSVEEKAPDQDSSTGKKDAERTEPWTQDANNLDVLIPVDSDVKDKFLPKKNNWKQESTEDDKKDKTSLDQDVGIPLDASQAKKPSRKGSKKSKNKTQLPQENSLEKSSHDYYNIQDEIPNDQHYLAPNHKETAIDDKFEVENDSWSKKMDDGGTSLNKSIETNVDDIFGDEDLPSKGPEINEKVEDESFQKSKKKGKKNVSRGIQKGDKESTKLKKDFDERSAQAENDEQFEAATSDSENNSSDPDTSQYVEYHVSLDPRYSGKSRIKKAKTLDSTTTIKEKDERYQEDVQVVIDRKSVEDDERIADGQEDESNIEAPEIVEPTDDIKTKKHGKKKSKRNGSIPNDQGVLESTATITEEVEISSSGVIKRGKKKKTVPGKSEEPLLPSETFENEHEEMPTDDKRQPNDEGLNENKYYSESANNEKLDKKKKTKDNYVEEITTTTTTVDDRRKNKHQNIDDIAEDNYKMGKKEACGPKPSIQTSIDNEEEEWKNDNTSVGNDLKEDREGKEDSEKKRKKKKPKRDYIEDMTTATTEDDRRREELQNDNDNGNELNEGLTNKESLGRQVREDLENEGNEKLGRRKKAKGSYMEEITTTTTVDDRWKQKRQKDGNDTGENYEIGNKGAGKLKTNTQTSIDKEEEEWNDNNSFGDDLNEDRHAKKASDKKRKKKQTKDDYMEETTTIIDDGWKNSRQNNEDGEVVNDNILEGEDLNEDGEGKESSEKKRKKKKPKEGYAEEITTTTITEDDRWWSRRQNDVEDERGHDNASEGDNLSKDRITNKKSLDRQSRKGSEEDKNKKIRKKKEGKDGYIEEITTTTEDERWGRNLQNDDDNEHDLIKGRLGSNESLDRQDKEGLEKERNIKLDKKKNAKDGYVEEITTTTTVDDRWKQKRQRGDSNAGENNEIGKKGTGRPKISIQTSEEEEWNKTTSVADDLNEDRIGKEGSEKRRKNKKPKDGYMEETATTTTVDDRWKSKMQNNENGNLGNEVISEGDDLNEDGEGNGVSDKRRKKKKPKDGYIEETTTTTTVDDRWKSKMQNSENEILGNEIISEGDDLNEDGEGNGGSDKRRKKKKPKDGYMEETITTTTTVDDKWKNKRQNNEDKNLGDEIFSEGDDLNEDEDGKEDSDERRKKKNPKDGYLEETTTTTTTVDDIWKSKGRGDRKGVGKMKEDKNARQFIETDFDCEEPLPPQPFPNAIQTDDSDVKGKTPGSKQPLKRNIPPLDNQTWNTQVVSPTNSDLDNSPHLLSVTVPNLPFKTDGTNDDASSGNRIPKQYGPHSKSFEEETVTTTTTTVDTLRWKRRPRRKHKSISFEDIPTKKQYQDKPLSAKVPDKTLQQAAFEMLQTNQAEVWRKSWKANPVIYTRGVYKPQQPLYQRDVNGENMTGKHDESKVSQMFMPTTLNDSVRSENISPEKNMEMSPEYSTEGIYDGTHGQMDDDDRPDDDHHDEDEYGNKLVNPSNNFSPYSKSYSPFIYNSLTRKVTYLKPLRRRRKYNALSLYPIRRSANFDQSDDIHSEPGPVDFSKYGYLSKLWMECVDIKTVQKSNTMYLSVLPPGARALDSLDNTLMKRYLQASPGGGQYDVLSSKDGSQWVIARGRSVRLANRKWMEQKENKLAAENADKSFVDGGHSPVRITMNQSFGNLPSSMLFFKINQINWPDLAWILFDGIQSDAETVRTIADVRLKHPDDAGAQIRDLMSRWWVKKGDAATIEELQNALEFVQIPYVQEEDNNANFFYPVRDSDEDGLEEELGDRSMAASKRLLLKEVSENDPDVSRMMNEYDHKSPNVSFSALADSQQLRDHDSPNRYTSSSFLQVPSIRESRSVSHGSSGGLHKDKLRLSSSSLQRSQSNLPFKQQSLPSANSSTNLGSQSSFRAFAAGLLGRDHKRNSNKVDPTIEVSMVEDGIDSIHQKPAMTTKLKTSSYDLESNL